MSATLVSLPQQEQQQLEPSSDTSSSSHASVDAAEKLDMGEEQGTSFSEIRNSEGKKPGILMDESYGDATSKTAKSHDGEPNSHRVLTGRSVAVETVTGTSGAAAIEEEDDSDPPRVSILPGPLRDILSEVAKTGESSSLTWHSARKAAPIEYGGTSSGHKKGFFCGSSALGPAPVAPLPVRPRAAASFLGATSSTNPKTAASSNGPPRKKQRNGIHNSSHRKTRTNQHLKRPLHLIRASATATNTATTTTLTLPSPTIAAATAAASGRFATSTSGSEPEDTSQYDSEGTSTTSASELSYDQHRHLRHRSQHLNFRVMNTSTSRNANVVRTDGPSLPLYTSSLREAFQVAVGLVLDFWFQRKGGYKLSPAEIEIHKDRALSEKEIFWIRKERLLKQLGASEMDGGTSISTDVRGPPFTIQRIAEVLVAPEKYYTQTHKLCNCLEKLLLVSSPTTAFGGSRGGVTSQSCREEQELAALADERVRIQSEFRQMTRRRSSLASDSSGSESLVATGEMSSNQEKASADSPEHATSLDPRFHVKQDDAVDGNSSFSELVRTTPCSSSEAERREQLEAAARASLRSKFDHVGIDPHHHNHALLVNANTKAIVESRGLTNSPPPPNLTTAPNLSGGLLRSPHAADHPSSPVRSLSPILFNDVSSPTGTTTSLSNPSSNMHLLQMHHAAALAGVSPFELMTLGTAPTGPPSAPLLGTAPFNGTKEPDVESRSSASSDVDSESDDISFDDSASDRSDGSDSGFVGTTSTVDGAAASNFSAVARAMALKRQQHTRAAAASQQQQRSPQQKMPPAVAVFAAAAANGESVANAMQDTSVPSPLSSAAAAGLQASDDMVPEDSDVSDSSLSDMAE